MGEQAAAETNRRERSDGDAWQGRKALPWMTARGSQGAGAPGTLKTAY